MFDGARSVWPVVYLLDANWYFGMVTDVIRTSANCGRASEAIVVGVGYPDDPSPQQAFRNVALWREYDLNPISDAQNDRQVGQWLGLEAQSGGGVNFLQFFKQ